MRFFTHAWWSAPDAQGKDAAFKDYERHWKTVRHFLPDAAPEFEAAHTLHDARLRSAVHDTHAGTLVLELDGWDAAFASRVAIVLRFSGVRLFSQRLPDGGATIDPADDVGYWEWDWTGDALELRMLFASAAELRVVATRFDFSVERAQESGVGAT